MAVLPTVVVFTALWVLCSFKGLHSLASIFALLAGVAIGSAETAEHRRTNRRRW